MMIINKSTEEHVNELSQTQQTLQQTHQHVQGSYTEPPGARLIAKSSYNYDSGVS